MLKPKDKNYNYNLGILNFMELIFLGLNMFLVPIKLGTSKFSPYLILILFLVPKKNYL